MRRVIFSFNHEDEAASPQAIAADCLEALMGGDFSANVHPDEFSVDGINVENAGEVIENWPAFARRELEPSK
jgi:hypothetical protein